MASDSRSYKITSESFKSTHFGALFHAGPWETDLHSIGTIAIAMAMHELNRFRLIEAAVFGNFRPDRPAERLGLTDRPAGSSVNRERAGRRFRRYCVTPTRQACKR